MAFSENQFALYLLSAVMAWALAGCASPAQTYVQKHAELSEVHKQILLSGKIPDGAAVAGMTRDQVQLTMGIEPAQYTKIDGQDAWVYVRKKLSPMPLTFTNADTQRTDTRNRGFADDSVTQSPEGQAQVKTTVVFDGERAVRADVVNGGL